MELLWLFVILSLIAEVLGTVGGFGSSLFFVPLASYFLDFHSVLGITALFHVFSNLAKIALFRAGIHWKMAITVGLPAVVCVTAGAYLSRFLEGDLLQFGLAVFLIVLSGFMLVVRNPSLQPSAFNSIASGSLSGLVAGLVGSGGAIRGLALSAFRIPKDVFIATSAIIDLGVDLSRSVVYTANGYVHRDDLYLVAILLLVSVAGTYIGKLVLQKVSDGQFRQIVLLLILGIGLITLVKSVITVSRS